MPLPVGLCARMQRWIRRVQYLLLHQPTATSVCIIRNHVMCYATIQVLLGDQISTLTQNQVFAIAARHQVLRSMPCSKYQC